MFEIEILENLKQTGRVDPKTVLISIIENFEGLLREYCKSLNWFTVVKDRLNK